MNRIWQKSDIYTRVAILCMALGLISAGLSQFLYLWGYGILIELVLGGTIGLMFALREHKRRQTELRPADDNTALS